RDGDRARQVAERGIARRALVDERLGLRPSADVGAVGDDLDLVTADGHDALDELHREVHPPGGAGTWLAVRRLARYPTLLLRACAGRRVEHDHVAAPGMSVAVGLARD